MTNIPVKRSGDIKLFIFRKFETVVIKAGVKEADVKFRIGVIKADKGK